MKHLLIVLLLILAALPTLAQDPTTPQTPETLPVADAPLHADRAWAVVDSVELTEFDGKIAIRIRGSLADGCERPVITTIERQGALLFVDVYQAALPADTICPMILLFLDQVHILPELLVQDENGIFPLFLVVNSQHFHIAGNQFDEGAAEPESTDIVLTPLTRTGLDAVTDVVVTELATEEATDGNVYVTIRGTITNGCNDPVLARVIEYSADETDATVYMLDVFRAIREPETCPLREAPEAFEFSVKTPVKVGESAEFRAGDVTLTYTPEAE